MKNNKSTDLFKSLRGTRLTKSDIFKKLEKFSKKKSEMLYTYLEEELNVYLLNELMKIEIKITDEQITEKLIAMKNGEIHHHPNIDAMRIREEIYTKYNSHLESLMYPDEFQSLYILLDILADIRESNNKVPIKKELATPINFDDSNCGEKIIMLFLTGVLDSLRNVPPFNSSINSLSTVVSGITGEKASTIQSYLNPIYSLKSNISQKNNPLLKQNNVEKIRQKLISIGYKSEKKINNYELGKT